VETLRAQDSPSVTAPDGCLVHPLLSVATGSAAHCTLAPGGVSRAVRHTVIQEIWYFVSGQGELWRKDGAGAEALVACEAGVCVTIPEGVAFQFRNTGTDPLVFLCFTMPPWPGDHAASVVSGKWEPTI
jgi:mannose-6-phosphate isomerase-like protein (cupin superfamily)